MARKAQASVLRDQLSKLVKLVRSRVSELVALALGYAASYLDELLRLLS